MMAENKNIPEIRFAGFTDPWEQRKLGEVGKARSGVGFPDTEQGGTIGVPFFKVSDMNSDGNENEMTVANNYVTAEQIAAHRWSPIEELPAIFFAKVGAAVMLNRKRLCRFPFLLDNNTMAYSLSSTEWDADFAKALFETIDLTSLVQVGALPSYNAGDVEAMAISMPSLSEQGQIGSYFRNLDNLITLHQRKYDRLKNVKKSMLEKMFPRDGANVPEIRFAGFTDAWEQRKLGDIATFINGRAYSQPELLTDGKYKVLRVGNFYTNDSWYYSDLELGEKYYANYSDLLYTWSATFGPHIWLGDKVIYHYHIWKIDLSDQLEKHFAVQLLEQDKDNILSSKNGSTMVHITKEGMEQKEVIVPSDTAEQEAIGAFFGKLDELITLHQRKYEKLKQIKKSMLEKMFV